METEERVLEGLGIAALVEGEEETAAAVEVEEAEGGTVGQLDIIDGLMEWICEKKSPTGLSGRTTMGQRKLRVRSAPRRPCAGCTRALAGSRALCA